MASNQCSKLLNIYEPPPEVLQHMANNAATTQLMPQLINQMAQLMQQMNSIQQQLNSQASQTSSITQSSSSSRRQRTNTTHYCWSHGACAHTSAQCKSKKAGHKDDATFLNKLGGSTAYSTPTTDSTST